jgi:hypothetical protein
MLENNKFVIKHNTKFNPVEFNKHQKEKLKKHWLKNHSGGRIDNRLLCDVTPLEAKQILIKHTMKKLNDLKLGVPHQSPSRIEKRKPTENVESKTNLLLEYNDSVSDIHKLTSKS